MKIKSVKLLLAAVIILILGGCESSDKLTHNPEQYYGKRDSNNKPHQSREEMGNSSFLAMIFVLGVIILWSKIDPGP